MAVWGRLGIARGFIRRRFRRWVLPALAVWAICAGLFVAGVAVDAALACPDLVPGTSDGTLPQSWQLFPPGPRCYYKHVSDYSGRGTVRKTPSASRGLLAITLVLWPATVLLVGRRERTNDQPKVGSAA